MAQGIDYMSEEEDEEDTVPTITMGMLQHALNESNRSVSEASYKKYLDMKEVFEREGRVKVILWRRKWNNNFKFVVLLSRCLAPPPLRGGGGG